MGYDVVSYYPSTAVPNRTVFRDSDWSSAIGSSFWHQAPILASQYDPNDFCVDHDEFTDYATSNYTATLNSGTVAISTAVPGGVAVVTSAAAATETTIQRFTVWNLHTTKTLYHESMVSLPSAAGGAFLVGLLTADVTPIVSAPTNGFYFYKAAGTTSVQCTSHFGTYPSTQTGAPVFVSDAWHKLALEATRTQVNFYFDGEQIFETSALFSSAIDVNDLRWCVSVLGATTGATVANVNYHKTMQAR